VGFSANLVSKWYLVNASLLPPCAYVGSYVYAIVNANTLPKKKAQSYPTVDIKSRKSCPKLDLV
jgi:hypothetical protein